MNLLQKLNCNICISLYDLFKRNRIAIDKISKGDIYICSITKALLVAWSSSFSAKGSDSFYVCGILIGLYSLSQEVAITQVHWCPNSCIGKKCQEGSMLVVTLGFWINSLPVFGPPSADLDPPTKLRENIIFYVLVKINNTLRSSTY